ncbi:MAG: alpha/beta hydrolase [Bacteroidetes bacterium QH_8_67_23]|nr:MAG: alpha/beta hydrolase [Bacteroidetes bacterium QH_8_67_23]
MPFSLPPWLDRRRYPFATHFFRTPRGRMHYVDEGRGAPVVFLHGNPTWSFLWRHLIGRLSRNGFRCIAPDYLGFGLSEKPPLTGFSYQPSAHAACVERLIEGLGLTGEVTLVMHDWGGPIGAAFATRHPERVRRLVIFNTWMWPRRDLGFRLFSRALGSAAGRLAITQGNVFARAVMPLVVGRRARFSAAAHRHYRAPAATPPERLGHWVFSKALTGEADWLRRLWRQRGALADLPALLMWGMRDPAFRRQELARWQEVLSQARAYRLPTVGHYVPEEAGPMLAQPVEAFLRGARSTEGGEMGTHFPT